MRIAIVSLLFLSASLSSAMDLSVYPDQSGPYPTISDAVAAAASGDRVLLMDGVFTGPGNCDVSVYRNIEIRNGGTIRGATIDCAGDSINHHRAFVFEYCGATLYGINILNGYADDGGAMTIEEGQVTVEECILNNNTATGRGGAIYCFEEARTEINNTVFSSNYGMDSGGGIFVDGSSDIQINHCDFLYNGAPAGGHLFFNQDCSTDINSSILAFAFEGAACSGYYHGTITATCSDIWNNSGGDWTGPLAGQLTGDNLSVDPQLCDPMGGNYQPIETSPVWAETTCGMIGAFPPDFGWGDPVLGVAANGHGQYPNIQTAMDAAQPGATILLEDGNYKGSGNTRLNPEGKAMTLRSRSENKLHCILDGETSPFEENRSLLLLDHAEGPDTIFRDLTFARGWGSESGGAIDIFGPVAASFINCTFLANYSHLHGGAIRIDSEGQEMAQVSFEDCFFLENHTLGSGGAIVAVNWVPHLTDCKFMVVDAEVYQGGAVHIRNFSGGEIQNCQFEECDAGDGGGALFLWDSGLETTTVRDCVFRECTSSGDGAGGAVKLLNAGLVNFENCTFEESSSASSGPDLFAESETGNHDLHLNGCTFTPAAEPGGSLYFDNMNVWMDDCSFTGYSSSLEFENTLFAENSWLVLENCQFRDCSGYLGGAAHFEYTQIQMNNCLFQDNHALGSGGAIYSIRSNLDIWDSRFLDNSTSSIGGAISMATNSGGDTNEFYNVIFTGNTAEHAGAAISLITDQANTLLDHCTLHRNEVTETYHFEPSQVFVASWSTLDIRCSIISGSTTGSAVSTGETPRPEDFITYCSNIWGNLGGDWTGVLADHQGMNSNVRVLPYFCDYLNDVVTLNESSFCLPENNPENEQIGALGLGCYGIPASTDGPILQADLLMMAYPNPFNPTTTLSYYLPARTVVTLTICDVAGRRVQQLVAGKNQPSGQYEVRWNGTNDANRAVPSGVYFVRLKAGETIRNKKIMLIK